MKKSQKELKAQFIAEAEEIFDELMEWDENTPEVTMTQIEEIVLKMRKKLGERMAQSVVERQENKQPAAIPKCPQCGKEMQDKGQKGNRLESMAGRVEMERNYYYCPTCQEGDFPPGQTTEDLGTTLE